MNNETQQEYFNTPNDPLYAQVKENITQGKRLPYKEYLRRRTIHYIEHVADEEDISDVRTALANRFNKN
jgi:ribosomal 50S subunit-associated protein YjgA (DUF615 family)